MQDLADGESTKVKGSGSSIYTLKHEAGVYSCTCPAWLHQSIGIEARTCKHLRAYRGDAAEQTRLGSAALSGKPARAPRTGDGADGEKEPPLLLAHKWDTETDLTGWWLSEKLDGVRAYWDGTQFLSRLGNRFHAPAWFVERFPDHPLDGELWGGRKKFQRTVGIVKRQDETPLWKELLFVVFDAPAHPGPFEDRIAHARAVIEERKLGYVRALEQSPCNGHGHLREELARVEGLGGEGLMARRPGSPYEVGRSSSLFKVKTFHDAEARVVGHAPGAGRHKGRLGALVVELADRTRFNVGTGFSDDERESPPAIGALITFRYQELSETGVPRFPTYVGVRIDGTAASVLDSGIPPADEENEETMARYELSDGTSNKFWQIVLDGTSFTTTFGRIGTDGQSGTKDFGTEAKARVEHDKLIAEKTKKGYQLVSGAAKKKASPPPPAAKVAKKTPEAATPPPAAKKAAAGGATAGGAARRFELVEGTSSKFWEISRSVAAVTTRFGRIGTDGQSSTKEHESEAKAIKEHDKLVAEKTKKGYAEV